MGYFLLTITTTDIVSIVEDHPIISSVVALFILYKVLTFVVRKNNTNARIKHEHRKEAKKIKRVFRSNRRKANKYIARFEKSELVDFIVNEIQKRINIKTIGRIHCSSCYFHFDYQYEKNGSRSELVSFDGMYRIDNEAMNIALIIAVANRLGLGFVEDPELKLSDYDGSPTYMQFAMKRTPSAIHLKSPI